MARSDNRPRGGGGGIVLPAAGAAGGVMEPVEAAGTWCCRGGGAAVWRHCGAVGAEKVTEAAGAAGRVAERAEGGCREPAPMLEVIVYGGVQPLSFPRL